MMDNRVPVRSCAWSGTGTVIVRPASILCIMTWLPRRRTSTKPCSCSIRQACRPDIARSLANRHFYPGHVHLVAEDAPQPRLPKPFRRTVSKASFRLSRASPDRWALAGDVQLRAKGHVAILFPFDDSRQLSAHSRASTLWSDILCGRPTRPRTQTYPCTSCSRQGIRA